MRNPIIPVLALLLAWPASAAAPIARTGRAAPAVVAPVAGLGTGLRTDLNAAARLSAPALSPSLSPALNALPASPLGAAPAQAPEPAAAALSAAPAAPAAPQAAAAADAPKFAGADAAAASAAGAQDALSHGDAAGARGAGVAAFDAGKAFAAPADAPEVPGRESAPRRLGRPSEQEVIEAFRAANPGSPAVDVFTPRQFAAAASDLLMQYTFASRGFLQQLELQVLFSGDPRGRVFLKAVKDLVAAHDGQDAASRRFSDLAGRYYAYLDAAQDRAQSVFSMFSRRAAQPHMPPAPAGVQGEYWDMVAGINAGRYVRRAEVDKVTPYRLFDLSPFVGGYLRASAEMAGKPNVEVREEDMMRIARPARPIAVLRTKNSLAYVEGAERKIEEMVDWIAEGGQLIIQNDPSAGQRMLIMEKHERVALRLLREGWKLEFGFSGSRGKFGEYGYDTIVFTRPQGRAAPLADADARKAWRSYTEAARYANAKEGY